MGQEFTELIEVKEEAESQQTTKTLWSPFADQYKFLRFLFVEYLRGMCVTSRIFQGHLTQNGRMLQDMTWGWMMVIEGTRSPDVRRTTNKDKRRLVNILRYLSSRFNHSLWDITAIITRNYYCSAEDEEELDTYSREP